MFCGINKDLMGFRVKDVEKVVEDIVTLSARYGVVKFTATDYIISRWHCDELFRRLKDLGLDLEIFYEIRADMKKDQLVAMRDAGINDVQPGIELFSTPLLKLMRKGTTAIKHVQFLRWCREIGIRARYNVLAGFPGEEPAWYLEMAGLIPKLRHLLPPMHNVYPIEMHRFAPLYEQRGEMGVEQHDLRPDYSFNFPVGTADPLKIAYFFTFNSNLVPKTTDHLKVVMDVIEPWIEAHKKKEPPVYYYVVGAGFLLIHDTRHGAGRFVRLADMHRDVVLLCDQVQGRRVLAEQLRPLYGQAVEDGTLNAVIEELVQSEVLMAEGEQLLTLPIGQRLRSTAALRQLVFGPEEAVPREAPSLQEDAPVAAVAGSRPLAEVGALPN